MALFESGNRCFKQGEGANECLLGHLRNCTVEPPSSAPYSISVWLARSSAELMGATMRSTVRKAARLAV